MRFNSMKIVSGASRRRGTTIAAAPPSPRPSCPQPWFYRQLHR
ncbi:MAG: hypothetical protein SOW59_09010 [Corynebacterium sp.]|nr:hypothetical protein [Corynebacterium sp.]